MLLKWVFFYLFSFNRCNEGQNTLLLSNNNSLENISDFGKQIFISEWKIKLALLTINVYRNSLTESKEKQLKMSRALFSEENDFLLI